MTPEGYEALKAEVEELEGPARRAIAERIKTAREWGDLKENSEYHDAKNEQAFLERRIAILTARLRNAEVVHEPAQGGVVGVGSTIELRAKASGKTPPDRLAGGTGPARAEGRLSGGSPLARAAVGHKRGDVFVWGGRRGQGRCETTTSPGLCTSA